MLYPLMNAIARTKSAPAARGTTMDVRTTFLHPVVLLQSESHSNGYEHVIIAHTAGGQRLLSRQRRENSDKKENAGDGLAHVSFPPYFLLTYAFALGKAPGSSAKRRTNCCSSSVEAVRTISLSRVTCGIGSLPASLSFFSQSPSSDEVQRLSASTRIFEM